MNKYVKEFLHRGLIFGGFGPIVLGIIYVILEKALPEFSLNTIQYFIATVSVYIIAFVQAGTTVFNQIEHWSIPKSLFCHFSMLYVAYVGCYLVNSWIPFDIKVIIIFTAIFATTFFAIWIAVFISVKLTSKKLNKKI
jgi:hypothetical protein